MRTSYIILVVHGLGRRSNNVERATTPIFVLPPRAVCYITYIRSRRDFFIETPRTVRRLMLTDAVLCRIPKHIILHGIKHTGEQLIG